MITIEGIDITGLIKENSFDTTVQGVTQIANDGTLLVYEHEVLFSEFTLIGGSDWGWLTSGVLQQIRALANVPGAYYTLNYEGVEHTVRFRSEDIPVMSATPLIMKSNIEDSDYFNNVIIKLTEV